MFDDNAEFIEMLNAIFGGERVKCPNEDCPIHYRVSKVDRGDWSERHMTYVGTYFVISEALPDSKATSRDFALMREVVDFTERHISGLTTPEEEEAMTAKLPFRTITEIYEVGADEPLGDTNAKPVKRDVQTGNKVAEQHAMHVSLLMAE